MGGLCLRIIDLSIKLFSLCTSRILGIWTNLFASLHKIALAAGRWYNFNDNLSIEKNFDPYEYPQNNCNR